MKIRNFGLYEIPLVGWHAFNCCQMEPNLYWKALTSCKAPGIPCQSAQRAPAPHPAVTVLFRTASIHNKTGPSLPLNHQASIMQMDLPQTDTCTSSPAAFNAFLRQDKHLLPQKNLQAGRLPKRWHVWITKPMADPRVITVTDIKNIIYFLRMQTSLKMLILTNS